METLMRWYTIDDPMFARYPPFLQAFGICKQEGGIYLASGMAGDAGPLLARAEAEGVPHGTRDGHVYLPAEWLAAAVPEIEPSIRALCTMAQSARPTDAQAVSRYMALVAQHGQDAPLISRTMDEQGFARTQIEKVVWFVPYALGRRSIRQHGMQFSDAFEIRAADGELVGEGKFSEEPVYAAAWALDRKTLTEEAVKATVLTCPEVTGFLQAMKQGVDPREMNSLPPVFFTSSPSMLAVQAADVRARAKLAPT